MSNFIQILNPTRQVVQTTSAEPRKDVVTVITPGARGPRGLPGDAALELTKVAETDLGGHRVVAILANGKIGYADPTNIDHAGRIIGFTTYAVTAGSEVQIIHLGEVSEASWSLAPSEVLFLRPAGTFGTSPDASGVFVQIIGFSTASDAIFINIHQPIILDV